MSDHTWTYLKSGWAEDEVVGPLAETAFVDLLRDGTITGKTQVMSPTRTKGAWATVQQIPSCMNIIEEAVAVRNKLKTEEKENRRLQRELEAKQKAESLRQIAEQRERQEQAVRAEKQRQLMACPPPAPPRQELIAAPPQRFEPVATYMHQQVVHGGMQPIVNHTTVVITQPPQSNRAVAVILNIFLFPGLGQLVQGRIGAGVLLMISWIVSIALCFFCVGFVLLPIVWLTAVIDSATNG